MTFEELGRAQLKYGDNGADVEAMQLGLRSAGYELKGTGWFGPATRVAVQTFQRRAGLTADGVFGVKTGVALAALLAGATPPGIAAVPAAEVSRPLWLEAGIKLIGTREGPGAGDNAAIIDWAKDEGGSIARDYSHDSIPWCALFGNHLLTTVGIEGTETLWALDFNADRMERRIGRRWPATRLPGIAVGAFAPMLRDGGGHIAVIVGKDQNGNPMALGGNQSDSVSIAPFAMSRLNEGFWWPASVPLPTQIGVSRLPVVRSDGRLSANEA